MEYIFHMKIGNMIGVYTVNAGLVTLQAGAFFLTPRRPAMGCTDSHFASLKLYNMISSHGHYNTKMTIIFQHVFGVYVCICPMYV